MFFKKYFFMVRNSFLKVCVIMVTCCYLEQANASDSFSISGVYTDKNELNVQGASETEDSVKVHFTLSQPARVTLKIYDARDYLVREMEGKRRFNEGGQYLSWDGLDYNGRPVLPEVYHYVLEAENQQGKKVIHDLTDRTGGEIQNIESISYDSETSTVNYAIPKSGRFYLRVGLEGSIVVKTLLNNTVQSEGMYKLHWDGKDSKGRLSFARHPKLTFSGTGYRLSQNSIVVKPKKGSLKTVQAWEEEYEVNEKRLSSPREPGLAQHAYHKPEECHDVTVELQLPTVTVGENINHIRSGEKLPLRASMDVRDTMLLESERSEIVYFLNEHMLFENEASYYPHTWIWDPKNELPGRYALSVFVVGFNGHYGTDVVRVRID